MIFEFEFEYSNLYSNSKLEYSNSYSNLNSNISISQILDGRSQYLHLYTVFNFEQKPDFGLENSFAKFKHKSLCAHYVNGAILFPLFQSRSVCDFFALFLPRGALKSMKTQKRDYYCVGRCVNGKIWQNSISNIWPMV